VKCLASSYCLSTFKLNLSCERSEHSYADADFQPALIQRQLFAVDFFVCALNFNPRIKVVPLIEVKTQDLFWDRAYHQEWSRKDMKERIVEERNTKYGKRVVKQIEGKIIIQKIREDKIKEDKKKSKRKKGKK
jgi:hypothetical protein